MSCCDVPTCPTVSLLCNSISVTKTKCGFGPYNNANAKRYLTQTTAFVASLASCADPCTCTGSANATEVVEYDPLTCVAAVTGRSGTSTEHRECRNPAGDVYFYTDCNGTLTSGFTNCAGPSGLTVRDNFFSSGFTGTTILTCTHPASGSSECSSGTSPLGGACFGSVCGLWTTTGELVRSCHWTGEGGSFGVSTTDITATLSDEYTTDLLLSTAVDALPAYATCFNCVLHSTDPACGTTGHPSCGDPDTSCPNTLLTGQGCVCSAFRNLSSTESSFTIRRFKYKFRFTASPSCRLRILWNEMFKPTLTASVSYCGSTYGIGAGDPDPAHWTNTAKSYIYDFPGDPCGPEGVASPIAPSGSITQFDSDVYEVTEPATNGTTTITDIAWSIINPNDPCSPDDGAGYPDCPSPDEYEPAPNVPVGINQFSSPSTSTYHCVGVSAADPNCVPPE